MVMNKAADEVQIGGDYIIHTNMYISPFNERPSSDILSAGTIKLGGDLIQVCTNCGYSNCRYGFPSCKDHKLLLEGDGEQTLSFDAADCSPINDLSVADGYKGKVVMTNKVVCNKLSSDVEATAENLTIKGLKLSGKTLKINGNITVDGAVDIAGGKMEVSGKISHTSGRLYVDGGKLTVGGDYILAKEGKNATTGEFEYQVGNGYLEMSMTADEVKIGGNFVVYSSKKVIGKAGQLRLDKDWEIYSDYNMDSLFEVVLYGKKNQSVAVKNNKLLTIPILTVENYSTRNVVLEGNIKVGKKNTIGGVVNVTGIALSKTFLDIKIGLGFTLTAIISPSNATNKNVIWKSSDSSIATVTMSGVVKGIKKGNATITATSLDGNKMATCRISVTDSVAVKSVMLNIKTETIKKGKSLNLKATINPSSATDKSVTWISSNTKVATVTQKGMVTGIKAGTATITVTTKDGNKKASCKVTVTNPVVKVKLVKLNKKSASIKKGKTVTLKPTISPSNATNKSVTWKSSDKKIATVTNKGVVKGIKKGKATITVTTKDGKKTASCKVTVK